MMVGKVGRILAGKDAGWYVKILDDSENTGGYLILTARDPAFRDGFDDWVKNEGDLAGYIQESGWLIEWTP